jgi:hypothetical protein
VSEWYCVRVGCLVSRTRGGVGTAVYRRARYGGCRDVWRGTVGMQLGPELDETKSNCTL